MSVLDSQGWADSYVGTIQVFKNLMRLLSCHLENHTTLPILAADVNNLYTSIQPTFCCARHTSLTTAVLHVPVFLSLSKTALWQFGGVGGGESHSSLNPAKPNIKT